LGAILGFLRLLYEHKEKIILGALIIAFTGVGYDHWKKRDKGGPPGGNTGGAKNGEEPPPPPLPPVPTYGIPNLKNRFSIETQLALTDESIFVMPEPGEKPTEDDKPDEWPTIDIKSIFDATKSGNFFAIIEVNGKREFMKEGGIFHEHYEVRRIDGVRNCLTIVNRRSKGGKEDEREFCK
jgi:hypothetical protein